MFEKLFCVGAVAFTVAMCGAYAYANNMMKQSVIREQVVKQAEVEHGTFDLHSYLQCDYDDERCVC